MEPKADKLKHSLSQYITTGLFAGIISAIINLGYFFIYETYTDYSEPLITGYRIALGSLIPAIFAGIIYFIVERFVKQNAFRIYSLIIILGTLISLVGPYAVSLSAAIDNPGALYILTFPMHIIVGAVILLMMKARKH
tara:strand:+ start:7268 stop:7681 length:414 start_codon:yes stop_codon:yes gene_type:complete